MGAVAVATKYKQRAAKSDLLRRPLVHSATRALAAGRVEPGATVVIVNWNSLEFLTVAVEAIHRFSRPSDDVEILVMDNASGDGSRRFLKQHGVRCIRLPMNLGHELALDIGVLLSRREFIVSLDVDAFPISVDWLDRLLDPLRRNEADVSGVHVQGGFVHPCCLAMRLDRFVDRRHTFMPQRSGVWAESADDAKATGWDTGWLISLRETRRHLINRSSVRGPGDIGSVWDDVAYHNFYSTRFRSKILPSDAEVRSGVSQVAARDAWQWAVATFLGAGGTVEGRVE